MRLLITFLIVLSVAGVAHAGPYRPIKAKHFCILDEGGGAYLQFISEQRGKTATLRSLWNVFCKKKECTAITLRLNNWDKGEELGFLGINIIENMTLDGEYPGRRTVSWSGGVLMIDPPTKTLSFRAKNRSGKYEEIAFQVSCPDLI